MTMERELSFENDAKFKDHLKSVLKKKKDMRSFYYKKMNFGDRS